MKVQCLVPEQGEVPIEAVLAQLKSTPNLQPFSDEVLEFCAGFARALSRDPETRAFGELQALAFWMRKAELYRLRDEFFALESSNVLLAPRGLVFHIPPSNVDTIFIYSWLLSVLTGNRNIVRVSQKRSPQVDVILRVFDQTLKAHPQLASNTAMLTYGHDDELTRAISSTCDMRVIWGGDQTIQKIRSIPISPHATELTFPDRFSLGAIKSDAFITLTATEKLALVERFFNDAYWFDQMGCSSPRLVVWVGDKSVSSLASKDFFGLLEKVTRNKEYVTETGIASKKTLYAYQQAIDHPSRSYAHYSNEVAVLELEEFDDLRGEFCGGGFFFELFVEKLLELVPNIEGRDQTMIHSGFTGEELIGFARAVNGKGIDRLVPFGQALSFNRYWDGNDLLRVFTKNTNLIADMAWDQI